jgi:peptide/nickel transport system permease protein
VSAGVEIGRVARNPALVAGIIGSVAILVVGVVGEKLAPYDASAQQWAFPTQDASGYLSLRFPPTAPDAQHLLGTDQLGRDQLSRLLVGARTTLTVVLAVALARLGLGITLGLAAGWYGAALDRIVRAVTSSFAAIPQLILAILLVLVLRPYGIAGFIAALALVGWPEVCEFVRAEVTRARRAPFIEAGRALGARDRWLVRRHVVAALEPELLTLGALEFGGVLLLLAELGLIGLFIAGATFYVDDRGAVILPIRDRAPEWGQMLGGIQFYIAQTQLVLLFPAIFVAFAALSFGLLAEGVRAAGDPFSGVRLAPRAFGALTRTLAAATVVCAAGFLLVNVRPASMGIAEGRAVARETAQRMWPGSELVAAVVRYTSTAHGMERPEKLTYYFRDDRDQVLRISFQNGDRLAIEARPFETEDAIEFVDLRPIRTDVIEYEPVLRDADRGRGSAWRLNAPTYMVRVILTWPREEDAPMYAVTYGTLNVGQGSTIAVCCYDARTGEHRLDLARIPQPFAVPRDCATTRLVPSERDGVSAYWAAPQGLSFGTFLNVLYQGDNAVLVGRASEAPKVTVLSAPAAHAAGAESFHLEGAFGAVSHGTLTLDASGCWTLRVVAGDEQQDAVIYVYPFDCRPPGFQIGAAPPSRAPCVSP